MNPLLSKLLVALIAFQLLAITNGIPLLERNYHVYHMNKENSIDYDPKPRLSQTDVNSLLDSLSKLDDFIDYLKKTSEAAERGDFNELVTIPSRDDKNF